MSNLFGINGVRGVVNETLTSDVALKLGRAIGRYYDGNVAVATDTRISADMIKNAVMAGLLAEGCDVFDLGIVPVPALQYFVKMHDDVLGGVMITASHNTAEYNGVKCISSTGDEVGDAGKKKIEENYDSDMPSHANRIGTVTQILRAGEEYVNGILEHVKVNDIKRAKLRVVVDCANGATSFTTPALLQRLGVYTVTLNANPQGEFPGRPSEPTEENLSDVIALIKTAGADLGVAHDLDGDRVSFISNKGKFIEGDEALAIMAKYILGRKKGAVVTTVSASSVVEDVVKENGGVLICTAVGSPIVAKRMREEGAVFGGEESGGMIFPEFQYCRDPALALARMLECILKNGPIQDQVDKLPVYYMEKRDVFCPEDKKEALMEHILNKCEGETIDTSDGIKVFYEDGWVLARPSGTENKFRIFSESTNHRKATSRANEFEKYALGFLFSI